MALPPAGIDTWIRERPTKEHTMNSPPQQTAPNLDMKIVPVRQYSRWVAAVIIGIALLAFAQSVVTNPRYEWGIVAQYFLDQSILEGLTRTIWLTIASMLIGIIIGATIAIMSVSSNPLLSGFAGGYIWIFRGTPLLVQLVFWYNLSALYPTIDIGLPFSSPWVSVNANDYITIYIAALLGLSLNEGAYMSEIVRSGLSAIPPGQREVAEALGLPNGRILLRVILPQAMRIITPPTGNQFIGMLKTTSLVSVIAMQELLYSAQLIYQTNFQTIPLLIVASLWYLILTTILTIIQHFVERHFSRSLHRNASSEETLEEGLGAEGAR